jgi:hypothetical protein
MTTRNITIIPGVTTCDTCHAPLVTMSSETPASAPGHESSETRSPFTVKTGGLAIAPRGELVIATVDGVWHERCAPANAKR